MTEALLPGERLPNGRVMVAIRLLGRKQSDWAGDVYAVIALTGHRGDCYAVWNLILDPDEYVEPYCYQGFYTGSFENAVTDWTSRSVPG